MMEVFKPVNYLSVKREKPHRVLPSFSLLILLGCITIFQISCTREVEEFKSESIGDYIPLQVGKYITYRVDSTVFTNFGRNEEIHKYQVKHVIDALITDNLGRPSYRVFRYISNINDTTGTPTTWTPNGSYFITPLSQQVEVIENNLRFMKMHLPVKNGFSWKGNTYLPPDPYASLYNFSNDDAMADWDYHFDKFETTFTYRGKNYSDVYTIEETDEALNIPITNVNAYASLNRAVEKYARNIGLVYQEYTLWEYQPDPGGTGAYKTGFGVTMWMVDNN